MKLRTATYKQVQDVDAAVWALRRARDLLKGADSPQAVKAVRRALKSVEGAQRHVNRRFHTATYPGGVIVHKDVSVQQDAFPVDGVITGRISGGKQEHDAVMREVCPAAVSGDGQEHSEIMREVLGH